MRRPTTRAAAAFGLGLLVIGPAATATPASGSTSQVQILAAAVSSDGGHDDHLTGSQDVAEWPDWARTGAGAVDADEHDHDTAPAAPTTEHGEHDEPGGHGDHDGHGGQTSPVPERPRALVLGSFAAVNGAVLMVAAMLRRSTQGEADRRRSARAAARRSPGHASGRSDARPPGRTD